MSEFTAEELEAKIAEAVETATGPLKNRITELEAEAQETEVGKAVADAVAAKDTEISELQSQLDDATAAKTAAEARVTEFETAEAERAEADAFAAKRVDRIAQAKEAGAPFEDEYLEEHGDRFAAMSDEDFVARLEEWKIIADTVGDKTPPPAAPKPTAMQATRTDDGSKGSALSAIGELRGYRTRPTNA